MLVSRRKEKQPFSRTSQCLELLCIILLQSKRSQILLETNLDLATFSGWCEGSLPWWATQSLHKKKLTSEAWRWVLDTYFCLMRPNCKLQLFGYMLGMLGFFVGLFCCFRNKDSCSVCGHLEYQCNKIYCQSTFPARQWQVRYPRWSKCFLRAPKSRFSSSPSDLRS